MKPNFQTLVIKALIIIILSVLAVNNPHMAEHVDKWVESAVRWSAEQ